MTMPPLTAISVFSGIGGLDLAARAAGFEIVAHVESDAWRRYILDSHKELWPHAQTFTDIKTFGSAVFPPGTGCDLIFGGFPCQDVSTAGKRAGLAEGTRSGLWANMRRCVGEFRPRAVVVENVAGLLSLGGSTVTRDLAELGYVGQWGVISAADAGATHRRERVFIVAYASEVRCRLLDIARRSGNDHPIRVNSVSEANKNLLQSNQIIGGRAGAGDVEHTAQTVSWTGDYATRVHEIGKQLSGNADRHRPRTRISTQSRSERVLGRDANGVSAQLDAWDGFAAPIGQPQHDYEPPRVVERGSQSDRSKRLEALGDAVVPQQAYPIFYWLQQRLETR